MNRSIYFLSCLLFTILLSNQCSKDNSEAKNIEQIYKEQGVPVRIEKIQLSEFKTELSYNSVLTGIEESSAHAMVKDKVEKICVTVGDYVKKDAVLLSFPTDNPAANYFQAKVAFENFRTTYDRMSNLYKSGGISLQDLDNAKAGFEVAKANWNAVGQAVKVKAPISGYVTKVNVRESDNVDHGDPLFTISKINKMKAKFWVAETEINDISVGLAASTTRNNQVIEGRVVQVDMAMDQDVQAFQAIVEFDNPNKILKCGTTVEIKIQTYSNAKTIIVERKNILSHEGKAFVYIVKNGRAIRKIVTSGKQQGLDIEITQGLIPGDELIVEGQMLLKEGCKVRVIGD